ncbi:OCIA domain-containing protein 2 isoform X1 [Macaca thibetana thibetana]|uniref:OCIA domain-containing protein 2 isoform X1 n=1 Tax=Macaca thibetana thibetana TaxID=257877 RepID=UPI0021BCA946|nr:OCIA domain-containing protein 2 isoform X1 [Macaca thibetana thibetana]
MASASTRGNQDKDTHLPPPSKQSLLFCPKSKLHIHRAEISKIMRECQEESFWKRALPFSLVSMLVTQGLVYQGTTEKQSCAFLCAGVQCLPGPLYMVRQMVPCTNKDVPRRRWGKLKSTLSCVHHAISFGKRLHLPEEGTLSPPYKRPLFGS